MARPRPVPPPDTTMRRGGSVTGAPSLGTPRAGALDAEGDAVEFRAGVSMRLRGAAECGTCPMGLGPAATFEDSSGFEWSWPVLSVLVRDPHRGRQWMRVAKPPQHAKGGTGSPEPAPPSRWIRDARPPQT